MKKDDLTALKHVGAARLKTLNDFGITTFKNLFEIPLSNLAQIGNIGEYYAKLIKDAVVEVYPSSSEKITKKAGTDKEKTPKPINQGLQKNIKTLSKRLKQTNEKLKPLGKKKYLKFYVDVKKRSNTIKRQFNKLNNLQTDLPKKVKINILKNADSLAATLKNISKSPKKKTYKSLSKKLESFTKMLRDNGF